MKTSPSTCPAPEVDGEEGRTNLSEQFIAREGDSQEVEIEETEDNCHLIEGVEYEIRGLLFTYLVAFVLSNHQQLFLLEEHHQTH
jgi:hypothetical protein